jgi:hypothetical protein
MESIKIEVSGNIARVIERPKRITAGTVGLPVEFTFDEHWEELRKTAVFRARHKTKIVENLETETTVPWELLQNPGAWLSVGVYGVNIDGSVAIPTIWANVDVIKEGADPEGDPGADPSLPVYQKLLDDVDDIEEVIDDIVEIQKELMNGADIEVVPSVHLEDTDNPHGVTAEQVGARPDTWIPTVEEVGARPDTWMPTAEEVGARPDTWIPTAEDVGAAPSDHADDYNNPHGVTTEQIGAAPQWYADKAFVRRIYTVNGNIVGSDVSECAGAGTATVIIEPTGLARIDFGFTMTKGGSSADLFDWGINLDLLQLLNPDIPNITPITGGTVVMYNSAGELFLDLLGCGGLMYATNKFWVPARVRDQAGTLGQLSEANAPTNYRFIGTCYGTVDVNEEIGGDVT